MDQPDMFTPDNFERLSHAISLFPDLEFATFAACYAEGKISFPVNDFQGLSSLFNDLQNLPSRIRARQLTYQSAQFFFRPELFPIVNIDDFLGKVFLSALWGSNYHQKEALKLS